MKLSGRELARFAARPDPAHPAILIYGPDPMRVADRRAQIIKGLAGENAEAEMRLERLAAGDVKADPAILADALKATGFFAGQRVVRLDEATDALAPAIAAALEGWQEGDAVLVATAGNLGPRSALRKLFEGHATALAAPVYADAAGPEEIRATLQAAGLSAFAPDAERDVMALGRALEPGEFRQFVDRLALYKLNDPAPVSAADVAACAPLAPDAEVDALVAQVAEGQAGAIAPLMRNLAGQGIAPVTICLAVQRHFRALHMLATAPDGPARAIARLRPPVFGPRRERMLAQLRRWRVATLETALSMLVAADLRLRSGTPVPLMAYLERELIRIAYLERSRR